MNKFHYGNTSDSNLLYSLQHQINDDFFWLESDGKQYVFLNPLESGSFTEFGNQDLIVIGIEKYRKTTVAQTAQTILEDFGIKEVTVPNNFPLALADALQAGGIKIGTVNEFMSERKQKTLAEISALRENFTHTIKAYEFVEQVLTEAEIDKDRLIYRGQALTSEYIKREVAKLLLDYDLTSPAGMIVSCGKDAAMPHHSGRGFLRPGQTIVVDIFPQSTTNHYWADMTRTYVKGQPWHEKINQMYEAVLAAQENAMKALRPGVECKMPHDISAGIIERAGFDVGEKGYTHSLGHGVGVAIHELPNLSPKVEGVLEVGNVVTVEPGLYYPDWGGVRIEDTVVITENGYENLTDYPKDNWLIN